MSIISLILTFPTAPIFSLLKWKVTFVSTTLGISLYPFNHT